MEKAILSHIAVKVITSEINICKKIANIISGNSNVLRLYQIKVGKNDHNKIAEILKTGNTA